MKYIFAIVVTYLALFGEVLADVDKDFIVPQGVPTIISDADEGSKGTGMLDQVFAYARDSIFGLLSLVAIAAFIYIGFRLISARGNPEEFKKVMLHLIYAGIGLFVISFAYAAVRLIAGINI